MHQNDYERFLAVMGATAEMLNQPKLTPLGLRTMFAVLQRYPIEAVEAAIQKHMEESPYMPKPCDIIRNIEGTAEERALIAWGYVLMAIARYGHYQSVKFDDPAIHYAIDNMGGWHLICQALNEELPFMKKDFVKHYIRGERVASWDNVTEHFVGEYELHNARGGHNDAIPELVFIQTRGSQKALDSGTKK